MLWGNRWLYIYRQVLLAAMENSRPLSVKCQTKDRFDWSPYIVHYNFSLLSIENCTDIMSVHIIVLYHQMIIFGCTDCGLE